LYNRAHNQTDRGGQSYLIDLSSYNQLHNQSCTTKSLVVQMGYTHVDRISSPIHYVTIRNRRAQQKK